VSSEWTGDQITIWLDRQGRDRAVILKRVELIPGIARPDRASMPLRIILVFTLAVAGAVAVSGSGPRAAPSLKEVMARVGSYAVSYGTALTSVIADEDFLQELVQGRDDAVLERRRLESEIAFVRLADTPEWLAFRSVLRVDGAQVADSGGQLERLFRETPHSALAQAKAITDRSARYNLGPLERNFNVPTTVLQFVLPQHQDRFRFRKEAEERVDGEIVWIVEFREQRGSTFIRTPQGRAAPVQGRIWVVPDDGRVVRSRLAVKSDVDAEIDVAWREDARLTLWVPHEMREVYRGRWSEVGGAPEREGTFAVRGVAKYSNYRRFEVESRILR
jgi:hypothetical protein